MLHLLHRCTYQFVTRYVMAIALLMTAILPTQSLAKTWDLSQGAADVGFVHLPETVKVFEVDGQSKSAFGHLFRRNTVIKLAEGKHQIKLRYEQFFDVHPSHEIHKSDPVTLFFTVTAGQQLTLDIPEITAHEKGREFAENPVFDIVNADGQSTLFTPSFEQRHAPQLMNTQESAAAEGEQAETHLTQLQMLWQAADEKTRDAFVQWLDAQ